VTSLPPEEPLADPLADPLAEPAPDVDRIAVELPADPDAAPPDEVTSRG